MIEIDVGDIVHHGPSNEDWVVAAVEGEKLYWTGYPFGGYAELSDCTLIEKVSVTERNALLEELASHDTSERPILLAKKRLGL